jgi:hypothetical protein
MPHLASTSFNWDLDHVPLDLVDRATVASRESLFYLLTGASFVEIAADLYTDNLIQYFSGDDEVVDWLNSRWKVEEVRHGRVLRDYVRHVWPEFDWEGAYAAFYSDYSRQCTVDEFEPTRGLEMVARCVVETGTATFYQALASQAPEPVLEGIAYRIRAEEINHYKHFYHYFRKYSLVESPGRLRVVAALKRRLFEARHDDAECALTHVHRFRHPEAAIDEGQFRALCAKISREIKQNYPVEMAAKMLLRPLGLPAGIARFIEGPLAKWTGKVFMG